MTTPNSNSNPLDRLARLAGQRTARTDQLDSAVKALLVQIEPFVEVGDTVAVGSCTLTYCRLNSNVGYDDFFVFECEATYRSVYLERPVGSDGYLHGDFSAQLVGPARADLIAFASHAQRFVDALAGLHEAKVVALGGAIAAVGDCGVSS